MPPVFDLELCSRCGLCDSLCPADAIFQEEESGEPYLRYPEECWHCGACRQDCPTGAISIRFPPDMLSL